MPQRHILVVVVDGLRASALGAYGNTTYPTLTFDQFAAESLLLDNCFATSPELAAIYGSLWRSTQPPADSTETSTSSLSDVLRDADYETVLLSDAPEILSLPDAEKFSRRVDATHSPPRSRADEIGQTALGRLFSRASNEIDQVHGGRSKLLWIHSHGMYSPWDAPLELQAGLFDEDDPPPIESIEPPDLFVAQAGDPDAAFRYGCAYAGQVMVLDECWSALVESMTTAGSDDWMIMLLGARGYPLGEHGRIGGVDGRLYAEQLHVPWLLHFPGGDGRLTRASQLVSHADVLPTIAECINAPLAPTWHGASVLPLVKSSRATWRQELVSVSSAGSVAIRTPEWCWRQSAVEGETPANDNSAAGITELFVRPDDRWEANDVAKLCSEDVENLSERAAEILGSGSARAN